VIWVRGAIVADQELRISVRDRTFEHGLGLFETFRTWNGHATLLDRHRERMWSSARALRLPIEPAQLPDATAVARLIKASREILPLGQDVRLRITLSGGVVDAAKASSVVWMSAGELPDPVCATGAVINHTISVDPLDPLARHKTLNYWHKRIAYEEAKCRGEDEVLCITTDGMIHEATRSNIFVVEGADLRTPGETGPLLPGVMRGVVLEHAHRLGLAVREGPVSLDLRPILTEAFLTNSLRGIVPIACLVGKEMPCPGPLTRRLWSEILPWLESGGKSS
jgi:branched-subunit amino acid aminotransferase/4-amino-4-deoxychorismate lyase